MAESIAVHFRNATWADLNSVLDVVAWRDQGFLWHYPQQTDYHVIAYEYDALLKEYDEHQIEQVWGFLGKSPSATLCIELLRSKGNFAVDSATDLVKIILKNFDGVVNDLCEQNRLWRPDEIEMGIEKSGGRFLDCYRPRSERS